jgi:hypothetical protein
MNHTPGPWLTNTAGSAKRGEPFKITEIYVYAPETQDDTAICADVIDPITQEPSAANATLIAAAPDLLDALTAVMADINDAAANCVTSPLHIETRHKARVAIAKATGA